MDGREVLSMGVGGRLVPRVICLSQVTILEGVTCELTRWKQEHSLDGGPCPRNQEHKDAGAIYLRQRLCRKNMECYQTTLHGSPLSRVLDNGISGDTIIFLRITFCEEANKTHFF